MEIDLTKQENDVKILSGSVKTSTILWHCLNWHIPLNFDLKAFHLRCLYFC